MPLFYFFLIFFVKKFFYSESSLIFDTIKQQLKNEMIMKTYIITFKCALSNEIKAVEFENVTNDFDIKKATREKYGKPVIILNTEVIEQSIEFYQA